MTKVAEGVESAAATGRIPALDGLRGLAILPMSVGAGGEDAGRLVEQLGQFAEAGVQTMRGALNGTEAIRPIDVMGRDVIPQVRKL